MIKTVLLIDDDEAARNIIETILKRLDYNIILVENGEQAFNTDLTKSIKGKYQ